MTIASTSSADPRLETPVPYLHSVAVIDSARLLSDGKLVHIEHRGELYSLRETRLGKLILTK